MGARAAWAAVMMMLSGLVSIGPSRQLMAGVFQTHIIKDNNKFRMPVVLKHIRVMDVADYKYRSPSLPNLENHVVTHLQISGEPHMIVGVGSNSPQPSCLYGRCKLQWIFRRNKSDKCLNSSNDFVSGCLSAILHYNLKNWPPSIDKGRMGFDYIDVGSQLLFSGTSGLPQNALSGNPKKNSGNGEYASEPREPKSKISNRVARPPIPEGYFFATFVAFLIGGLCALIFGLGVPQLIFWLEDRCYKTTTKNKSHDQRERRPQD